MHKKTDWRATKKPRFLFLITLGWAIWQIKFRRCWVRKGNLYFTRHERRLASFQCFSCRFDPYWQEGSPRSAPLFYPPTLSKKPLHTTDFTCGMWFVCGMHTELTTAQRFQRSRTLKYCASTLLLNFDVQTDVHHEVRFTSWSHTTIYITMSYNHLHHDVMQPFWIHTTWNGS